MLTGIHLYPVVPDMGLTQGCVPLREQLILLIGEHILVSEVLA